LVRRLLFLLSRGLETWETEDLLRSKLVDVVGDSAALETPAVVLARVIDFQEWTLRSNKFEGLFAFCVEYLRVHGSSVSQVFRTLDVGRLDSKDLDRLCILEQLN
jgi:hypothetical protein